jgi:predicted dehydrogenase
LRICCERVTMVSSLAPYTPDRDPWTFIPRMPDDKAALQAELARVPAADEGYALQFAQFHASLNEGRDPPVTLADGRRSLELLSALYHAARTGQRVMLPIGEDHRTYHGWLAQ